MNKNKYFLFLDKRIKAESLDNIEGAEDKGYYLSFTNTDDLLMPWCDIVFEDNIDGHYEYTLGRYNSGIWETYLFFTSDKRLIIEEEL